MEGHETALCYHTHIYLLSRTLQIRIISYTSELYLPGDNTSITNQKVPVFSPLTGIFIGQLSHALTNILNVKGHIY